MDTFWTDFWQPGAIVRQILLMIVIPCLIYLFWRYWSHRSAKSIQRRIKEIESEKVILDNIVGSDRQFLLYCFISVFSITSLCCLAFVLKPLLLYIQSGSNLIDGVLTCL
jgi:hypothetical protein